MSVSLENPSPLLAGAADAGLQLLFTIAAIYLICSPSFLKGLLIFTLFPPLFYFSLSLFTKVVRAGEVTHLGFAISVFMAVILFWVSVGVIGLNCLYAIFTSVEKTAVALLALAGLRLAYALAYGSRIGGILTAVDFAVAAIVGLGLRKAKPKKAAGSCERSAAQPKVKDE
jgi:hypothetical protein